LVTVDFEGAPAYLLAADAARRWNVTPSPVRLLPQYDVYVFAAGPRERVVPPAVKPLIFGHGRGRYEGATGLPVLLVDGVVAGMWQREEKGAAWCACLRAAHCRATRQQAKVARRAHFGSSPLRLARWPASTRPPPASQHRSQRHAASGLPAAATAASRAWACARWPPPPPLARAGHVRSSAAAAASASGTRPPAAGRTASKGSLAPAPQRRQNRGPLRQPAALNGGGRSAAASRQPVHCGGLPFGRATSNAAHTTRWLIPRGGWSGTHTGSSR
jgi:hypothetical protein